MTRRLILEISGPRMGSTNLRRHLEAFERVEAVGEFLRPPFPMPENLAEAIGDAMAERGSKART